MSVVDSYCWREIPTAHKRSKEKAKRFGQNLILLTHPSKKRKPKKSRVIQKEKLRKTIMIKFHIQFTSLISLLFYVKNFNNLIFGYL